MAHIKLSPLPLHLLHQTSLNPAKTAVADTIEVLQQQVEELREHQDRTSFYLREISQWAEHVKRK